MTTKSPAALSNGIDHDHPKPQRSSSLPTGTAIELSENFYINNRRKNNVKIQVKLNAEGIYLRRETDEPNQFNELLIRMDDIIGSRCGPRLKKRLRGGLSSCKRASDNERSEGDANQKDTSAFLYIYAYIKKEKPLRRTRTVRILRFRSYEHYEDNFKSAERWHNVIKENKCQPTTGNDVEGKQLLILLNPKSGSGKGRDLFHQQVAPVLKEAEIQYELTVTTHANMAREFVRSRNDLLQQYYGIVVASGDGLFYEVLNGLMERTDWRAVSRQLPIGILPCGSGNGLAKSIAHLYNEPYEPKPILNATLTCVFGNTAHMDIVRVELGGGQNTQMYSFLSVGWGLIADIDIESERLRRIGAQRFTLWTIHRLIKLRTYRGKLSYLPVQEKEEDKEQEQKQQNKDTSSADAMQKREKAESTDAVVLRRMHHNNTQEFYDIPEGNNDVYKNSRDDNDIDDDDVDDDDEDNFIDAISLDKSSARPNTDSWYSATSRRTAYYSITGQSIRSRRSVLSKIEAANAEFEKLQPGTSIPPLSEPLPADGKWHCEEGEYIMVHAAYTTHLATDCFFAPDSRLNDGIIYLVIIRAGVSRSQLIQFLLSMSSGTHLPKEPHEYIEVKRVKAFRIEPSTGEDGIIAVDGERVSYGPIQGEILPGILRIMVPNGDAN